MQKIEQYNMRKWMRIRGKKGPHQEIVQRKDLRKVFEQLDEDHSGTLCLEELYEPLLSLGLVEKRQEVEQLIEYVGSKNSGIIEFHEFLRAFDLTRAKKQNRIDKLLGEMERNIISSQKTNLPFTLIVSNQRRNLMMNTYMGENSHDKDKGMRVLKAYAGILDDREEHPTKLQRIIWRRSSDYAKINSRISQYKSKFENSARSVNSLQIPRMSSLPKNQLAPRSSRIIQEYAEI
jgi:hypothetical protein